MAKQRTLFPHIGVKDIRTDDLFANPHNPRTLFDKIPLKSLKESIDRVGILVPLTVYFDKNKKRYIILDGQRRWMCAQELKLTTVPVNEVAEPTLVQNIVTMFQIHKLREDWDLMPTALKIELLMREINDRRDATLAELTGLDESVIVRCKKLLSYDKRYQDRMLDPDPGKRLKADFFIELYPVIHDREISKFNWFSEDQFTDQMLDKYLNEPKTLKAVTDFRIVKQHVANAKKANKIATFSKRLREFAESREKKLDSLEIEEASVHAEAKAISKKMTSLEEQLTDIDVELFYGEENLWMSIKRLIAVLEKKLKEAEKLR